jgi:hypothetical protein
MTEEQSKEKPITRADLDRLAMKVDVLSHFFMWSLATRGAAASGRSTAEEARELVRSLQLVSDQMTSKLGPGDQKHFQEAIRAMQADLQGLDGPADTPS